MSKPSPPPSPTRRQSAAGQDASLDATLDLDASSSHQQPQQHSLTETIHHDEKSHLDNPIGRYHQQTPTIFPASLPLCQPARPSEDQAGVSNAQLDRTYDSFPQNSDSKYPSYFNEEQQKQSSSSPSSPSINRYSSPSSYEMNNEVVPNVSAYFLYQNANRDHFKSLNPQMSPGELSKYISQHYKSLEPQEKAEWTTQASQLNASRLSAQQSISRNHLKPSKKPPSKKRKDPDAPKRAVGAYVWFTMEERPKIQREFKGIKFAEIGKMLGARWRGLTPAEKKKYNLMASKDRDRLQTELKAYKEKQTRQQKARKAQADSYNNQQQGNPSKPQHPPQPVADVQGYNPEYEYSDEFCSDIIKRLGEHEGR